MPRQRPAASPPGSYCLRTCYCGGHPDYRPLWTPPPTTGPGEHLTRVDQLQRGDVVRGRNAGVVMAVTIRGPDAREVLYDTGRRVIKHPDDLVVVATEKA